MPSEPAPLLDGKLHLLADFIDRESAHELMTALLAELPLEERSIVLFGKPVLQPRLVAWAGDEPYRYSGSTLEPRPWPPTARQILNQVNRELRQRAPDVPPFNHLLANYYRDGRDSMGMHSDDEPELGPAPWVASVSLGGTRRFVLAPRTKTPPPGQSARRSMELTSGSLLLMEPPTQSLYRHGVPRTRRPCEPRLNLTFRAVILRNRAP